MIGPRIAFECLGKNDALLRSSFVLNSQFWEQLGRLAEHNWKGKTDWATPSTSFEPKYYKVKHNMKMR